MKIIMSLQSPTQSTHLKSGFPLSRLQRGSDLFDSRFRTSQWLCLDPQPLHFDSRRWSGRSGHSGTEEELRAFASCGAKSSCRALLLVTITFFSLQPSWDPRRAQEGSGQRFHLWGQSVRNYRDFKSMQAIRSKRQARNFYSVLSRIIDRKIMGFKHSLGRTCFVNTGN